MRIVIQRSLQSSVSIGGSVHASAGPGMMILVGIADTDTEADIEKVAAKTATLRIFNDEQGVMNRSIRDCGGEILAISQFTLLADTRRGNRPSYIHAMRPPEAARLYDLFCSRLAELAGCTVAKGIFGADMQVELVNDGPVTIVLDSM